LEGPELVATSAFDPRPGCDDSSRSPPLPVSRERIDQLRSRIRSMRELRAPADERTAGVEALQPCGGGGSSSSTSRPPEGPQPFPRASARSASPFTQKPQDKLNAILSFLDEVEESSRADISSLMSSARSSRTPHDPSGWHCDRDCEASFAGGVAQHLAGRAASHGLANDAASLQSRLALLEVEVKDKRTTIDALKRALVEAREHEKQALLDTAKEWENKLHSQKAQYETGLERNLKLVDRLLNDKTELTKRCELFAEELKMVERKYQLKIEEADDRSTKELERQKKNWIAAEKLRREAWEKDKVREIKEMTIKGLQPEVERILAERKQERQRLEDQHKDALEEQRKKLMEHAQAQVQETRERLNREQERAIEEEREFHRKKAREEFERFTAQLQEERRKCAADLLSERRRQEDIAQRSFDDAERKLQQTLSEERAKANASLQEAQSALATAEEKRRGDLAEQRRQLHHEAEEEARRRLDEAAGQFAAREAALREEMSAERDRQLDVLMDRLSREHVEQQHALREESAALSKHAREEASAEAKRLTEQLEVAKQRLVSSESQVQSVERALQSSREERQADLAKVAAAEERARSLEEELASARRSAEVSVTQQQEQLREATQSKERELAAAQLEVKRLRRSLEEERGRVEQQRQDADRRQEQVVGDLEARVKRTLQAKDETISELRLRCGAADNKIREFEYLLARQRDELLADITGAPSA